MSENQPERNWGTDAVGIALFAAAAFVGASVIMSWIQPVAEPGGSTALVTGLVAFVGELPVLVLCLAAAWLGSRFFLGGGAPENTARLGATCLIAGLGLSVLLGGAWGQHGGQLGETAVGLLTPLAATLFGLALIAAPIWHFWVRPLAASRPSEPPAGEAVPSFEVADPVPDRPAETSEGGLSAAEADALLPRQPPQAVPLPVSPYPPDVRLEGRIPEGARPIQTESDDHATREELPAGPASAELEAPAVHPPRHDALPGGTQDGGQSTEQRPGQDLAAAGPLGWDSPVGAGSPDELTVRPLGESQASGSPAAGPAQATPIEDASSASLPSPSWEQPGLFSPEEPVDAYGTPLSLVESLRTDEEAVETAEVADAVEAAEPVGEPSGPIEEAAEAVEAAEEEEYEEEEEEEEEEDSEEPYAEEEEYEEEEGDEEEEYEEEYEEEEEPVSAEEVAREGDEEEDEEEEYEEEEDEDEEVAAPAAEEAAEEVEDEDEAAEADVEIVPHRPAEPVSEAPPPEPQPKAAQEPATAAVGSPDDGDELVFKAGALILDRNRVAVSLLQREFRLDFDEATAVLDRLQEAGLIGPYVGGQSRDILLTPEQWTEKRVGAR